MESNIQANAPETQELAHLLRELPRQTPPAELTDRIMAGLPGRPGIIGLLQYNLLRPRQLPAAASAALFLPAALFQLLLATFLYHFFASTTAFLPTTWLTLQPSLLATTAWLLLLAAWQLRGGRQREATVSIIVYSTIMLVDVSWPLLLAPEPLLLPVALGLLLPPLLILVPWALTSAPRPLRRYPHVAATIHPC